MALHGLKCVECQTDAHLLIVRLDRPSSQARSMRGCQGEVSPLICNANSKVALRFSRCQHWRLACKPKCDVGQDSFGKDVRGRCKCGKKIIEQWRSILMEGLGHVGQA
jgi:hypothetical protein